MLQPQLCGPVASDPVVSWLIGALAADAPGALQAIRAARAAARDRIWALRNTSVRDEPEVRRKIAMFAGGLAHRQARSAKVQILIRDARHVDNSLAPVWAKLNDEDLAGMTMLGRHLLDTGQLRDGIHLDEVRDVLWNYLAIDAYERLVLTQGWLLERCAQWLARAITSAICA